MRKEERHQIKRDDLASVLESATDYVADNRRTVLLAAGGIVVVLLLGAAGRVWWGSRQAESARRAGELIATANASIVATVEELSNAQAGVPTFTSTEERARKVLELADTILAGGTTGMVSETARLYRGSALADLGRADEAATALEEAARRDPDGIVGGTARLRLAHLRETQGKPADALVVYQAIADSTGGALPREEGLLGVARCQEALGLHDDSVATYKRLLQEFPESEYASEARTRTGANS